MGLSSDIVVVNRFSVPVMSRGRFGTRGGTPGRYVMRYMARPAATEVLAPIRRDQVDDYMLRYMAREQATEHIEADRESVRNEMRSAQGLGGVAFGYGSVSLTDEQVRAASTEVQGLFEGGHTVLETVLSFSEDYLRRHGIIEEGFTARRRGDYRGNIDQLKLRLAIMHGLERMGHCFDDLRYVGVIQVDTMHVHCHLVMVDAGRGTRAADGTQRGKLSSLHKSRLRRGIDAWLDGSQRVAHLSSAVGYERRNVAAFIKRWAYQRISTESLPQFLLACLPEDRRLWRAGSNDRRMAKANRIVTDLVAQELERPGSPMPEAMAQVRQYANHRRESEGLSTREWHRLVEAGRARIVERCVNGVYSLLRSIPEEQLGVRTPMLDIMGMDYTQMATSPRREDDEDLVGFGFRLRSYATRLREHREQAARMHDYARQWEQAPLSDAARESSRALVNFYRLEEVYHRGLAAKYRHFLPYLGDGGEWDDQVQELEDYWRRLQALVAMRGDTSLLRMRDGEQAEHIGRAVYDQPGGAYLTEGEAGRAVIDSRIGAMREHYDQMLADLRSRMAGDGFELRPLRAGAADGRLEARRAETFDFEQVKALDLHHLGYDFTRDAEVGSRSVDAFTQITAVRSRALAEVEDYLLRTGQSTDWLPQRDVAAMVRTAQLLREQAERGEAPRVVSRIEDLRREVAQRPELRRSSTDALDSELALRVRERVDAEALRGGAEPEAARDAAGDREPA